MFENVLENKKKTHWQIQIMYTSLVYLYVVLVCSFFLSPVKQSDTLRLWVNHTLTDHTFPYGFMFTLTTQISKNEQYVVECDHCPCYERMDTPWAYLHSTHTVQSAAHDNTAGVKCRLCGSGSCRECGAQVTVSCVSVRKRGNGWCLYLWRLR